MGGMWSEGGQRRGWGGTRAAWGRGRAGPAAAWKRAGGVSTTRRCAGFAGLGGRRRRRRREQRRIVASLVLAAGGAGAGSAGRARGPRGHRGAGDESGPGMASARPPGRACAAVPAPAGLRAGPPALPAAAAASPEPAGGAEAEERSLQHMLRAIAEERGRVSLRREVCGLGEWGRAGARPEPWWRRSVSARLRFYACL